MKLWLPIAPTALLLLLQNPVLAEPAVVENVSAESRGDSWTISVTILHPDTGWDHYTDGWEVLGPDGDLLGFRELVHPHVNEQPFTRSLSGVVIPAGTEQILIRSRGNVSGWDEKTTEWLLKN